MQAGSFSVSTLVWSIMYNHERNECNKLEKYTILLVYAASFLLFHLSAGCMNPARTFGLAIVARKYDRMWLYWVRDMTGTFAGALLYDKVFSTKVCRHWIKRDCWGGYQEEQHTLETGRKLYIPHSQEEHEM